MNAEFAWKAYTVPIAVQPDAFPRQYGLVRRAGREHVRNYRREIRNGLSVFDLMTRAMDSAQRAIRMTSAFM